MWKYGHIFFHFGGKTHPRLLEAKDVEEFLFHLAIEGKNALMTKLLYGSGPRNKPGSTRGLVATPCALLCHSYNRKRGQYPHILAPQWS